MTSKYFWLESAARGSPFICLDIISFISSPPVWRSVCFPAIQHLSWTMCPQQGLPRVLSNQEFLICGIRLGLINAYCINVTLFGAVRALYVAKWFRADREVCVVLQPKHSLSCFPQRCLLWSEWVQCLSHSQMIKPKRDIHRQGGAVSTRHWQNV